MGANDKAEATYGGYTPDTENVEHAYVAYRSSKVDLITGHHEFERWLATVKAQALTDLADQVHSKFTAAWIRGKAREYTHGPHKPVGAFSIPETEADCGDQD